MGRRAAEQRVGGRAELDVVREGGGRGEELGGDAEEPADELRIRDAVLAAVGVEGDEAAVDEGVDVALNRGAAAAEEVGELLAVAGPLTEALEDLKPEGVRAGLKQIGELVEIQGKREARVHGRGRWCPLAYTPRQQCQGERGGRWPWAVCPGGGGRFGGDGGRPL